MDSNHIFDKEVDAEKLALDIVEFLLKWGMWQDVQIFTGGMCYTDVNGELKVRCEQHPEKYLTGLSGRDCNGDAEWQDFSNPERLLDMTMEGPFSLLLRHHEYEVNLKEVSDEVRHIIGPKTSDCQDMSFEMCEEYMDGKLSWDPAEYDSYEEWLELNQYLDVDEDMVEKNKHGKIEFSSREEYEDFLLYKASEREFKASDYFDTVAYESMDWNGKTFFDDDIIASQVIDEFDELLEKYGLWYELGFSWSLTTYRR